MFELFSRKPKAEQPVQKPQETPAPDSDAAVTQEMEEVWENPDFKPASSHERPVASATDEEIEPSPSTVRSRPDVGVIPVADEAMPSEKPRSSGIRSVAQDEFVARGSMPVSSGAETDPTTGRIFVRGTIPVSSEDKKSPQSPSEKAA